jgi:hypothetical protein
MCVRVCVCLCGCECVRVCVCVCARACVCVRLCMYMYIHRLKHVCICMRLCRDRTSSFNSTGFLCAAVICAFMRCRRDVHRSHHQRAVGWPIFAHVDRRRRRHLRPRRLWHRRPLQGRLGEHRRRCAAGLACTRQSTRAGYTPRGGFLRGLKRCTLAVLGVLQGGW